MLIFGGGGDGGGKGDGGGGKGGEGGEGYNSNIALIYGRTTSAKQVDARVVKL